MTEQAMTHPPTEEEYYQHIGRRLGPSVLRPMHSLRMQTHGIFHNSSLYFTVDGSTERILSLLWLSDRILAANGITLDTNETLATTDVVEGLASLQVGYDEDARPQFKLTLLDWDRNQGKFATVTKNIIFGNCPHCFKAIPIGMKCHDCTLFSAISQSLYFVYSDTAEDCDRSGPPPAWFTERYRPSNPFKLCKLMMAGTVPYFDTVFYERERAPRYDDQATHLWTTIPLHRIIDKLVNRAGGPPEQLEDLIRDATYMSYIDIYDCVNTFRNQFQPEDWDRRLPLRSLDNYQAPDDLYFGGLMN